MSVVSKLFFRFQQLNVSRSRNIKQKIYEIFTSPKIQMNGVILYNCIDQVCLCFDRLLLLDLSAVQVLHTQYVATFQDRKTSFLFWEKFLHDNFVSRSTDLQSHDLKKKLFRVPMNPVKYWKAKPERVQSFKIQSGKITVCK